MSAADAAIEKRIYGSGTTAVTISNEEIEDIMKIVKSLEESGLLIKGISETIKNEAKEQKGLFPSMLLGRIPARTLRNVLDLFISCSNLRELEYTSLFSTNESKKNDKIISMYFQ